MFIHSRFKSICHETKQSIFKGDSIFYDRTIKKAFSEKSERYQKERINTKEFIQDPGEIEADNFCINNNI
jgi:hypothetical protein